MYMALADMLFLTNGSSYSRAVPLLPWNAVEMSATALALAEGTVQVHVEASDDGENWTEPDQLTYINLSAVGHGLAKLSPISFQFVRLKYLAQATGDNDVTCVLSAGLNLTRV